MQVKFVMESRHAARSTGGRSKPELRWMRPQLPKLVHTTVNTAHLPSSSVIPHFRSLAGIVICRELLCNPPPTCVRILVNPLLDLGQTGSLRQPLLSGYPARPIALPESLIEVKCARPCAGILPGHRVCRSSAARQRVVMAATENSRSDRTSRPHSEAQPCIKKFSLPLMVRQSPVKP